MTILMSSIFILEKYRPGMKWEIWGAKAPVIEESKASFKHQTSNNLEDLGC
jgi:hypothetical protein